MRASNEPNFHDDRAGCRNATRIRPLFGADVITVEASPTLVDAQLYPEELACIRDAVPKRRAEFGTARVCARRALAELGIASMPLVPRPDRSPTWPAGVVGSITHTKDYCAVAIARNSMLRSVGVDAEQDRTLDRELIALICTAAEREHLARRSHGARDAILYFAAKEAFYKCQYPLTRTFLDFQDVDLELDHAAGLFQVRAIRGLAGPGDWRAQLRGRFLRRDELVLCGVELASLGATRHPCARSRGDCLRMR